MSDRESINSNVGTKTVRHHTGRKPSQQTKAVRLQTKAVWKQTKAVGSKFGCRE